MSLILEEGIPSSCVEDEMVKGGHTYLWEAVAMV